MNLPLFRSFHVYRESAFQIRFEPFNALDHAILTNPNATVDAGIFAATSPAAPRVLQFGGRFNF